MYARLGENWGMQVMNKSGKKILGNESNEMESMWYVQRRISGLYN